ncbi:hypothetical protein BJF91_07755 [Allorhizobium taibaishanense]|uniref:Uncharacterized protein n=1 Tax=Allorhizobium taibaishanense TaxID=887144 RepID=A0A1Q9A977_9HYPH|nr:hypothetical protein BJF91_07755 [Allorhizobium taibaishanense]
MKIRAIGFSQRDFQTLNRVDDVYLEPFDPLGQGGIKRGELEAVRTGDNALMNFQALRPKLVPESREIGVV